MISYQEWISYLVCTTWLYLLMLEFCYIANYCSLLIGIIHGAMNSSRTIIWSYHTLSCRLGDLPKLDLTVDRGTDFTAWKSQWQAYFSLSGLENQSTTKQVQALTLCFSRETITIVNNMGLTEEQQSRANDIIAAIELYVQGRINESVECRNFRRWVQQEGETFDDFLVSLRELAKTCSFCSEECTMIR